MKLEEIDITNIKIETGNLFLRPFEEGDLDDLYAYASIPGVGEAAGWKHHESREESQTVLKAFIEGHRTFAITEKESGKVIGSVSFEPSPDTYRDKGLGENINEIGYIISRDYWGKGYAVEAVQAVIGYAFCVLHLDAVTCGHLKGNDSSRRVIEKCGFKFICESEYADSQGEKHGACYYALTHTDYGVDYKS